MSGRESGLVDGTAIRRVRRDIEDVWSSEEGTVAAEMFQRIELRF